MREYGRLNGTLDARSQAYREAGVAAASQHLGDGNGVSSATGPLDPPDRTTARRIAIAMRSQSTYADGQPSAGRRMTRRDAKSDASVADFCLSERVAVWTLRQLVGRSRTCFGRDGDATCGLGCDFQTIAFALHEGLTRMAERRNRRLHVGQPSSLALTMDEWSLLQALAAAQRDDERGVHASLQGMAPDCQVRSSLVTGVMTLAASLGIAGYWLADVAPTECPPAAVLLVAGAS
jgi:hypothetical protein